MGFGCLTALNSFGNPSFIVLYGGVKTAFCEQILILHLSPGPAGTQHLKQNRNRISSLPCSQKDMFHPPSSTGACWGWEKEPDDHATAGVSSMLHCLHFLLNSQKCVLPSHWQYS